jgi:hypothetical protein
VSETRRGLPGGIALPAAVFVAGATVFVVCWLNPELVDLGPHFSPAGIGVLTASMSLFWLLVAIARRPSR